MADVWKLSEPASLRHAIRLGKKQDNQIDRRPRLEALQRNVHSQAV